MLIQANKSLSEPDRIELAYQTVAIDRHPRGTLPSSQAEQGRIAPGIRVLKQQEAAPSIIMSADMSMHCHKHVMKLK